MRWPERRTSSSASSRPSRGSPIAPKPKVPEGFTPIFNGQNLTGWHASPTNHHGVTPDFRVIHGAIVGTQSPFGDGGILLTDKSYKNFDLYMEVRPDYGCDSGMFFRSTESGHAYQITMDYLPGGSMGRLITETINGVGGTDRAAILATNVRFLVSKRMAGKGRAEALPDKAVPIRFSGQGVPVAYPPQCATEAKYLINMALMRAHTLMGVTMCGKNHFGSVYFDAFGFTPQPLHNYASRDLPMGSYNCLVDLIGHKHLGGKTVLYMLDALYASAHNEGRVLKYQSLGDHWSSSLFMSQDPVAIDSVGLDFVRNEPRADECRGTPENYLHEAALADKPPSGTVYDPNQDGKPVASLGVHEHWNNATDKQYSRNLGRRQGIELVAWPKGSKTT